MVRIVVLHRLDIVDAIGPLRERVLVKKLQQRIDLDEYDLQEIGGGLAGRQEVRHWNVCTQCLLIRQWRVEQSRDGLLR